jgi:hypothetical protein
MPRGACPERSRRGQASASSPGPAELRSAGADESVRPYVAIVTSVIFPRFPQPFNGAARRRI